MVPEREAVLSWGDHLDLVDPLPQSCLVLPLGLSLSQRVFMKCTEAAVGPLRRRGIRVAMNIDDWLSAASSRQAADHTHTGHLADLGFRLNIEKSVLLLLFIFFPCQTISFIGLFIDSVQARVRMTVGRLQAFRNCSALFHRGNLCLSGFSRDCEG